MNEPLIERNEIVGLLFNVSDIAVTLTSIEELLRGGDEEEEVDEAELEEMRARHAKVLENAERTRKLAEKALAKLEADAQRSDS